MLKKSQLNFKIEKIECPSETLIEVFQKTILSIL